MTYFLAADNRDLHIPVWLKFIRPCSIGVVSNCCKMNCFTCFCKELQVIWNRAYLTAHTRWSTWSWIRQEDFFLSRLEVGLFCFEKKRKERGGSGACIANCVAEIALEPGLVGQQQAAANRINEYLAGKVCNIVNWFWIALKYRPCMLGYPGKFNF